MARSTWPLLGGYLISIELTLSLRQNAYHFLNESMRNAERGREEDAFQWTFAIANSVQAIELLLKERLRQEHPLLVFTNIDRPRRHTVSLETALERLKACDVDLGVEVMERLQRAKGLRNDVVHYELAVTDSQLEAAYVDVFEFAHAFHVKELGEELHEHLDPDLWHLEAELMGRFHAESVTYQGERLGRTLPAQIVGAQQIPYYRFGKQDYLRVSYGREKPGASVESTPPNCPACGVLVKQLHVPGCSLEVCPACHERVMTCECEDPEFNEFRGEDLFESLGYRRPFHGPRQARWTKSGGSDDERD